MAVTENTKPSVAKNSLIMLSAQVVIKLLGFFFTIYAARVLGVDLFGQYGFGIAIITLFAVLSEKGLNTYQTRQTAYINDPVAVSRLIADSLYARLILSAAALLALVIIAIFLNKPSSFKIFFILASLAMTANFFMGSFSSTLLGYERFKLYGLLAMGTQLFSTILGFITLYLGFGLIGIGATSFITSIVATIIVGLTVKRLVCKFDFAGSFHHGLSIIKSSLPLAITAVLMTIYYRADFVMLSFMKNDEAVGYYNSAYALINGLLMVSTSFSAAILPRLSGYFKDSREQMQSIYQVGFKYMLYFGLAIAVGAYFVAQPIYELFYPESYWPASVTLRILIWALALMFVNALQSGFMIASNLNKQLMYITGLGALINIILNLLLIPNYSFNGAAAATVVSELLTGIGFFFILRHNLPLRDLLNWLIRFLPSAIAMAAFLIALPHLNVIARIIIGAMIAITVLLLFRGLDWRDINFIVKILPGGQN